MTDFDSDDSFEVREARSVALNAAVAEAIKTTLAEHGCMAEDWTGLVGFITPQGKHGWCFIEADDMMHITNRAMIQFMSEYNEEVSRVNIREQLRADFDGE